MILGYPWLQEHKVAVLQGEDALGVGREIRYLLVGWPEQEKPEKDKRAQEVPKWIVRKMALAIDGFLDQEWIPTPWRMNENEMVGVMRICGAAEKEYAVKTLVTSQGTLEWGEHQELVNSLRADILKEFTGTALAEVFQQDPPVRGKTCAGRITLKAGARAKKQRMMSMQGERLEALKEITKKWLKAKKVTLGMGEWSSPCFDEN